MSAWRKTANAGTSRRDQQRMRARSAATIRPRRTAPVRQATKADLVLGPDEATLLDLVDNVLSKGVVLTGDVTIGLANVDLVYARLSLLLCAADRVMPGEDPDPLVRHSARHAMRERVKNARGRG
jgi:hypothetical protein